MESKVSEVECRMRSSLCVNVRKVGWSYKGGFIRAQAYVSRDPHSNEANDAVHRPQLMQAKQHL